MRVMIINWSFDDIYLFRKRNSKTIAEWEIAVNSIPSEEKFY